jgi:hypothetical protein
MTPLPHAGVGSWRFWGGPRTLPSASESGLNAERAVASNYHEAKPKRLDGAKRSQSHPLRHDPNHARIERRKIALLEAQLAEMKKAGSKPTLLTRAVADRSSNDEPPVYSLD